MASFCNPKVFESPAHFRKYYDRPILAGREPGATDKEVQLASERQEEMNRHCNDFILRRTNDILSDHLPPKVNTQPASTQQHCVDKSNMSCGDTMWRRSYTAVLTWIAHRQEVTVSLHLCLFLFCLAVSKSWFWSTKQSATAPKLKYLGR